MNITTQDIRESASQVHNQIQPEFFRLPPVGKRDPYFGLTRAFYYELEYAGQIRLTRLRQRGKQRGVTLVPYDEIANYIKKQGNQN